MTTRLLRDVGKALYGPRWQSDLARDLAVSGRTVRYWAAGKNMPDGAYADLMRLCDDRVARLEQMQARLEAQAHTYNSEK